MKKALKEGMLNVRIGPPGDRGVYIGDELIDGVHTVSLQMDPTDMPCVVIKTYSQSQAHKVEEQIRDLLQPYKSFHDGAIHFSIEGKVSTHSFTTRDIYRGKGDSVKHE